MNVSTLKEKSISQPAARDLSDWRFVSLVIVGVLIVTSLPYVFAYVTAPADKQFMGIMLDVPDHGQYFSWMRELTTAHLSANKLTPEPNKPVFFNLLWWSMGRFGLLTGLDYAAVYQVLRIVGTATFLTAAYWACTWFLKERLQRRAAFLTLTFTSGFGWILVVLKYTVTNGELLFPLDVFVAEGNTFLSILGYPHFVAAATYIVIFGLLLYGQARRQMRYAVFAGLIALFLGWQHAYDLALVYGISGFYTLLLIIRDRKLPWRLIFSLIIIGFISWWPALYSVILTSADPIWNEVLAQFANAGVYSPNLLHLPILLGPAFLLALFSAIKMNPLRLKQFDDNFLFLIAWFWANFALIYIPTDYQIHMLNGWQVPISVLAVWGLFRYVIPAVEGLAHRRNRAWSSQSIQRGAVIALLLIIIPTNVYLLAWRFIELKRYDYPYFLHRDEIAALNWLESNAQPDDVTLSSLTVGQYVPAETGTFAFLAHWAQTVDFYNKEALAADFFDAGVPNAARQEIINAYSVDYIIYGPAERQLGDFSPENAPFLAPVFNSPQVQVYQVLEQ